MTFRWPANRTSARVPWNEHGRDALVSRRQFLTCAWDHVRPSRKHRLSLARDLTIGFVFCFSLTELWISLSEALLQQRLNAEIREIGEVKYNLLTWEDGYSYYLSEAAQSWRKWGRASCFAWEQELIISPSFSGRGQGPNRHQGVHVL